MNEMKDMMARHARDGRVEWIGIRPARREAMRELSSVRIDEAGLQGDRSRGGKRAVTLIQSEHLPVVAAMVGHEVVPELLRRNVLISGVNIFALKGREVQLGGALLRVTGLCHPCSRMEEVLGHGGFSAMRGHGGICAEVLEPGTVALGDALMPA